MSDIVTRLKEATGQLLQPGSPYELGTAVVNGAELPVYVNAPATVREALDEGRAHGDGIFVVYEGERWSFDRFYAEADRIGHLLLNKYGIRKGDRVAIAMRNYPEWMAAYLAAVSIGAVVVPLNSWGQADELEYGLTDANARLVFCDQQRLDYIAPKLKALGIAAVVARPAAEVPAGVDEWAALQAEAGDVPMPEADIDTDDTAMILYTSGTTGRPKGAVSTHRAVCQALFNFELQGLASATANPETIGKMMEAGYPPATLLNMPLFHVSGCFAVFMLNLRGGRKTVIMYKWDADKALALIESERITTFSGAPIMNLALLESPAFDSTDTRSLFALGVGGAATPPHLREMIYSKLPDSYPGTGYGSTETCATGSSCTGELFRVMPGTSGIISPLMQIKAVDDGGRELPRGERGEIHMRCVTNVSGYWNLPEATAASFRDGWFATGDIGYVDENNLLFIVDRLKDMVIRGGENIYPVEVESCIIEHPDVLEVTAYGLPHDSWGEELAATVYSRAALTPEDVRAWVAERLAGFKVPTKVTVQDHELPKNPTGKILKKQVRQACLNSGILG